MKRFISLLLGAVLLTGSIAGCGNTDKQTQADNQSQASDSQTTAKPDEQKKQNDIADITWYVMGTDKQCGDIENVLADVNPLIKEKIGVNLIMKTVNNASYQDKMQMVINSNEYYDICWTSNWRNNFYQNIGKGAYADLTDLMAANAPDILKAYPKTFLDYGVVDGKQYGILNVQLLAIMNGALVQTDIAKKYNFDVSAVKTYADFEPLLQKIKANEKGLYPLEDVIESKNSISNNNLEWINNYVVIKRDDPSLTVLSRFDAKDYMSMLDLTNEWYKKGYIRSDAAAVSKENRLSDINANKYAVKFGPVKPGFDVEWSTRQKLGYSMVILGEPKLEYNAGVATMNAVSVNSKHADKALQLLNLVHTDKAIYNKLVFGVENKHYTKISDNVVKPIDGAKYNMSQLAWELGNNFNALLLEGQNADTWKSSEELNNKAVPSPITGFVFNQEPVQNEIANLTSVDKEFNNIQYTPKYKEKMAEFIAKMKDAGIDKVVAEVQKQLDEWKTKYKK